MYGKLSSSCYVCMLTNLLIRIQFAKWKLIKKKKKIKFISISRLNVQNNPICCNKRVSTDNHENYVLNLLFLLFFEVFQNEYVQKLQIYLLIFALLRFVTKLNKNNYHSLSTSTQAPDDKTFWSNASWPDILGSPMNSSSLNLLLQRVSRFTFHSPFPIIP